MSNNQSEELSVTGKPKHLPVKSGTVTGWNRIDVGQKDPAVVTGDRPLDKLITEHIGSETEFVLPRGEYVLRKSVIERDFDRLKIVGKPHATIRIVNDLKYGLVFGAEYDTNPNKAPSELRFENITIDVTKDGVGPVCLRGRVSDHLYVNNVDIKGQINSPNIRKLGTCLFAVTSWQGHGYVNIQMPDGAAFHPNKFDMSSAKAQIEHPIGINSPPDHRGSITFEKCRVEDFPNNGFYLSGSNPPPGPYTVRRCTAKNNGNSQIRVGPNDVVEDSYALLDNMSARGLTACGMWMSRDGASIRGGRIVVKDSDNDGLRVSADGRVRDLTIENECAIKAVDFPKSEPKDVVIDGLTLFDTGNASGPAYAWEMDSSGVTLRDVRIIVDHNKRRGIYVGGADVTLDGVRGDTSGPGEIVAIDGKNVSLSNCRLTGKFNAREGCENLYLAMNRHDGETSGIDEVEASERNSFFN